MSRSIWKPLYKNNDLTHFIKKSKNKNTSMKIFTRNIQITMDMVGFTFLIHTGNNFRKLTVKSSMVGQKLGEFAPTRKKPIFKKKKK